MVCSVRNLRGFGHSLGLRKSQIVDPKVYMTAKKVEVRITTTTTPREKLLGSADRDHAT